MYRDSSLEVVGRVDGMKSHSNFLLYLKSIQNKALVSTLILKVCTYLEDRVRRKG